MANFTKHFEYDEFPLVTGEIWTTHGSAHLLVSEAANGDVLAVDQFSMQGRQWGEHPVTDELHTAIRHLMQTHNTKLAKLNEYMDRNCKTREQREHTKMFPPAYI